MIDVLRVDQAAFREVEVDTRTEKLLCEHRYIEAVAVESGEVAACERVGELFGELFESGCVFHHLLGDTRKLLHEGGDRLAGVDEDALALFLAILVGGAHLDIRNLNDSVVDQIEPRSLQIEDYEGFS